MYSIESIGFIFRILLTPRKRKSKIALAQFLSVLSVPPAVEQVSEARPSGRARTQTLMIKTWRPVVSYDKEAFPSVALAYARASDTAAIAAGEFES
jgi:hypothetical protein